MTKLTAGRIMGILAVFGVLLAACSGPAEPTINETQPKTDEKASAVTQGTATLVEVDGSGVSGEARLQWNPDTKLLAVTTELRGVEEGARYISIITPGCEQHSGLLYQTGVVVGGSDGTATVTTEVANVEAIDFDGGWAVKVALPGSGEEGAEQACGEVEPS